MNEFSWFVISIMYTLCSIHFGMGVQLLITFHLYSAQNLNVFTLLIASPIVQQSRRWNNYSGFMWRIYAFFSHFVCKAVNEYTLCRQKQERTTHITSIFYQNDFAHLHLWTRLHTQHFFNAIWTRCKTVCSVTQSVI